ncbi:hypothetical protein E3V36_06515 [Candidatus Marinimicrobia bacterium MT.SAG.2]|nr:hypothetical protein E3V36_06515 [Candidatus Marinimicrobia bacterium MT.SAG.2]
MGQQQLLLIVLGTIIVGVAVVVGINMFTTGAINAERDALLQDVNNIASSAAAYWRKPAALGGGARTFDGIISVTTFGAADSNANGEFVLTGAGEFGFTVTATGGNEGVEIVATITQNGVSGTPTITMP